MRRRCVAVLSVTLTFVAAVLGTARPAEAAGTPAGRLVSERPAGGTPHVLDGRVYSVAQVGDTMVLGGTFSTARNDGSQTRLTRHRLLAFDVSTGRISTTFVPDPNGTVTTVVPAGDGTSVYVAGSFSSIGGVARNKVARVRVSDGAVLETFDAGRITGQVKDLRLAGGRLWLAGSFAEVGGHPQAALATVDPATGAFDPYMGLTIAGVNDGGRTNVGKIDVTPDGLRLAAIGNFDTIAGSKHHQLFLLDLSGGAAAVADFQTAFYESQCSSSFNTYMRDLDFSPDGSFFVVSTTGAYRGSDSACDETSRWETGSTGRGLLPSWTDYTGGDTTYAVEVTDSAVYTGGHFRWQNNAFAGDRPGPGAVARTGLAALDPINGLPFSWNPTRTRGVGVFDFLLTSQGLWVASDTVRIDHRYHGRIALLPRDGESLPAVRTPSLPDDVYVAGADSGPDLARRWYSSAGAGPATGVPTGVPTGGIDWSRVRGAFMVNGQLYVAGSDGSLTRRSFDGRTYGSPTAVDTSDRLAVLSAWHDDVSSATGMFLDSGRIYFTLAGSDRLYYRYFTPEDGVIGAERLVAGGNVPGIDFSQVRGMFVTGDKLFWASPDGSLHAMSWRQGAASGAPVAGTAAVVSGPGVDGADWAARSLFLFQGADGDGAEPPVDAAPSAAFTSTCTGLACKLDATGSSDPDGDPLTYSWDYGDGATGSGAVSTHTYSSSGPREVTLTVSDGSRTDTVTHQVSPTDPQAEADLGFVDAASTVGNRVRHHVRVPTSVQPGDTLVMFMTTNTLSTTVDDQVDGWTLLRSVEGRSTRGRVWTRTATASDAGSTVTVTTSGYTKSVLSLAAYRAAGGSSVTASAASVARSTTATHTTPPVPVADRGSWVLSYWSEKSTGTTTWTAPDGVAARATGVGSGKGNVSALLGDSGGEVPTGTAPGRTATASDAAGRVVQFSVVVGPQA